MAFPVHLTFSEYTDFGYSEFKVVDGFSTIEKQAQRAVDSAIDYYYNDRDISQDKNAKRVDAYKMAI